MLDNQDEMIVQRLATAYTKMSRQFEVDAGSVRQAVAARRRRAGAIASVTGMVALAAVGGVIWDQTAQPDQPAAGSEVIVRSAAGLETHSSSTARDWVTGADLVAVVTVRAESRGPAISAGDGTGDQFVERSVTLDVVRQVWAHGGEPGVSAGDTLDIEAPGWVTHGDESTSRLAFSTQPRLETGHTYVVALSRGCADDAGSRPVWAALGSGAVLPADGGRIGFGESEGRDTSGDVRQTTPGSLEREMLGRDPSALTTRLDAAGSDPRRCA